MDSLLQKKVLFAGFEDEFISQNFKGAGLGSFMVLRCTSGMEAIELCLADAGVRYLVIDVNTSQLNGFEVAGFLRKELGRDLVIIMLGWFSQASADMAYSVGCDEFIAKPLDLEVITSLLKSKPDEPGRLPVQRDNQTN